MYKVSWTVESVEDGGARGVPKHPPRTPSIHEKKGGRQVSGTKITVPYLCVVAYI